MIYIFPFQPIKAIKSKSNLTYFVQLNILKEKND